VVKLQGLLCYWCTSNGFSLLQAAFLRIPRVRQALNIPAMVVQKVDPASKKSIVQTVKDSKLYVILMQGDKIYLPILKLLRFDL